MPPKISASTVPGSIGHPPVPLASAPSSSQAEASTSNQSSHNGQPSSSTTTTGPAPKKRLHNGTEKRRKKEGADTVETGEKKVQVSSCDTCKEGHRKCNGLEPCMTCQEGNTECTYNKLNPTKKKAHDAYVISKRNEQAQRLKNADIIVARLGDMDIGGTNNNFGPILSQVINLPRYEPPPSDFKNDKELILGIGKVEKLLIDCYFKHFNYYLPILSRKAFMAQVMDKDQLETLKVQKLLACVLATGFAFRQEIGDHDVINKMEPNYGTGMCRKFHHFNTQDVFNSSIENCQCYLILTGFYSSITNYDAVHNLVALAHSVAASQGLNRNKGFYYQFPGDKEHTVDTIELGHRLFWCVVIVCSGYSLSHQSPFITSNDYDIPFPLRQLSDTCPDFQGNMQDDFAGIKDLGHFVPMYEISSRIADITCTATRQRPHTKVDEAREMLQEWRTKTLPDELRITPYDMDAIRKQTRFSKFYHAVGYMFEICLHHTFQLHESHRTLGVHGVWSSYCYDAAVGIKNIYQIRPMTRMNSHVILPVAAGAFANIVASKLLGKEDTAQKYCDDIKLMLSEIVRASSSVERDRLVKYVGHGYSGVTRNADGQVENFEIHAPESPPWNERSPAHTAGSSPAQTTDVTGDTDEYSSDENGDASDCEDGQDQRMFGQTIYTENHHEYDQQHQQHQHQQQQQQQQNQPIRSHPSMTSRSLLNSATYTSNHQPLDQQQQQHSVIESNYPVQGYNGMLPTSQTPMSTETYSAAAVSYTDANGNELYSNRQQMQHRDSNVSSFSSDGSKTTGDSGFSSSHGQAADQDTYFAQRHQQSTSAAPRQQQHQSFSAGHPLGGGNAGVPRQHQSSVTSLPSATSPSSASGFYSGNMPGYDSSTESQTYELASQGMWGLNEAQLSEISELQTYMANNKLTPQERQSLQLKLQQIIALASPAAAGPPTSASHAPHGGFTPGAYNNFGNNQYILHQQHNQSNYAAPISLNSSQLLSGGFDGPNSMLLSDSLDQDLRFYQPMMMSQGAVSVSGSTTSKSFSESSDLSSPISPISHQQHQQMPISSQNGNAIGNMMAYQQQQQHHQPQGQVLNISSFPGSRVEYTGVMQNALGGGISSDGSNNMIVGLDDDMGTMGIPSNLGGGFYSHNIVADGGGFESLMGFGNDPQMVKLQEQFSSVASKGQQQQQLQQRRS
ncbi:hypothetical protein BGX27_010121 [Mortierella sp. AM989]|nr:hypothetical protein BGX27_010121 [Mortierella sp. AM989]